MILSIEKIKSLSHIPTEEIYRDQDAAKRELAGYVAERDAIEQSGINPSNQVRHYFLEGKIDKGREFISELEQVIEYRLLQAQLATQCD